VATDRPPALDSAALLATLPGASPRLRELLERRLEVEEWEREWRAAHAEYAAPAPPARAAPPAPAPASPPVPAPAPGEPEYLDVRQAARLLGTSVRSLEGMRRRGTGPAYVRHGKRVRYRRSDLLQGTVQNTGQGKPSKPGDGT